MGRCKGGRVGVRVVSKCHSPQRGVTGIRKVC